MHVQYEQVGTYSTGQLVRTSNIVMYDSSRNVALSSVPTSTCSQQPCYPCMPAEDFNLADHTIIIGSGDITIAGLFSAHQEDNLKSGSCGQLLPQGVEMMQAFFYAINTIEQSGILSPLHVGGIAFDICSSLQVASSALSFLQPGSVDALVADQTDALLLPFVEDLQVPYISYTASSSALQSWSLFAGSSSSEGSFSIAVLSTLAYYNVTSVLITYTADKLLWARHLQDASKAMNICVSLMMSVSSDGSDFKNIIVNMRKVYQANTVIMLIDPMRFTIPIGLPRDTLFVLPLPSVTVRSVTQMQKSLANSTCLFVVSQERNISPFQTYLQSLNPNSYTDNPWFTDWYEKVYSCFVRSDYNPNNFSTPCSAITKASQLSVSIESVYTIDAVELAVRALKDQLILACGSSPLKLCTSFVNSNKANSLFAQLVKSYNFVDILNNNVNIANGDRMAVLEIYSFRNQIAKVK